MLERIKSDLKGALKASEALRVETLRGILAALHNEEIAKRTRKEESELREAEIITVLRREAKKRQEAADIYKKAERENLATKELKELKIIKSYLPPEIKPEELERIVKKVIAGGLNDFGGVMRAVMKEVNGRAEAKTVSEIVKKELMNG